MRGFLCYSNGNRNSGGLDVGSLLTFRAGLHFEANLLVLLKCLEAFHADLGKMGEQVFTAAVRRDEAKALCVIEPT
jgi:hypothetical protein